MQPDLILIPFGENATPGTIDPIPQVRGPDDSLQQATWNEGFPQVTMTPLAAGGTPPKGQDFNGVLKAISEHTVFVGRGGQYKWSDEYVAATGGYSIGDVIQADTGLNSYVSLVDNNTVNFNTTPASIGTSWGLYAGRSTQSQATETAPGIAEIATQAEVATGADDARIVTPLKLRAAQATQAEAEAGVANNKLMTPLRVFQAIAAIVPRLPLGYFNGFGLSNNGAAPNTTVDVAAGSARDSANTVDINLSSSISGILQASGVWAAGTGQNKLDAGAKAINTWYHVFAIRKTVDGSGDILFSKSLASPVMPTGYSGFVLLESVLTDASGNIIPFINFGKFMMWKTGRQDVSISSVPASNLPSTISTPLGRRVLAKQHAAIAGNGPVIYTHSPDTNNEVLEYAGSTSWTVGISTSDASVNNEPCSGYLDCITGLASNIVMQTQSSGNLTLAKLTTLGWEKI